MFEFLELDTRITRKLSLGEFAIMVFIFCLSLYFTLTHTGNFGDYYTYLKTAKGSFSQYFYGYWLIPFLFPFSLLPFEAGYLLWVILGILGVWFAARVFNGKSILALLSYQMSYALFWGQISGIICGMLALFWWAMYKHKWILAGLALLIAAAKPQSGGVFAFFLLVLADIPWREKMRILIVPGIGVLLSFVFYPGWIFDLISRTGNRELLITWANISLWQWIGPWSLLLFIPAMIIPMNRQKRFFALVTASILSFPYFLQTDLLTLFIFPVGFVPVLFGYLPGIMLQIFSFAGQPSGVVVPLMVYIWQFVPERVKWFNKTRNITVTKDRC